MSWLVAVILIGQVGSGGGFAGDQPRSQAGAQRSAPIAIGDSETTTSEPSIGDAAPPLRPNPRGVNLPPLASEPPANTAPPVRQPPTRQPPANSNGGQPTLAAEPANATASSANPPYNPASEALQAAVIRLEDLLTLDQTRQTELRNLRLIETLSRNADPSTQAKTISDYWELSRAAGKARFAGAKALLLEEVPQPKDETDRALLDAALTAASAEEAAAQDELLAAQYLLVRSSAIPWEGKLPWPADVPFVGAYRTSIESLFANRPVPVSLKYLHECLPGKLRLIERRVIAMSAAESVVDVTLESYKRGAAPITALLQSVERLDESRKLFLSSVIDYNGRIAEYSVAAVGSALPAETLVSTLIKTTPDNSVLASNSRPSLPREAIPRNGISGESPTGDRSNRTNLSGEINPRDVHPASVESPAIQPEQRIIRR